MVLGGGDGSKPSVSFLNFEPKVSKFPRPEQDLFWSSHHGDHYLSLARFRSPFTTYGRRLFVSLATDIRTVEQAFCVLFVEFVVDDVLAVFDGVCCGNQHINASTI